jgi:predicted GTPase
MTRDRLEANVSLFDLCFRLVDTPGLDDSRNVLMMEPNQNCGLDEDLLLQSQVTRLM